MSIDNELLVEIGTEEIPARFIPVALKQMAEKAEQLLAKARIRAGAINTYGTPRRLILQVDNISDQQDSFTEEVFGPPRRICYDAAGQPTKAALGFAKNQGVLVEELQIKSLEEKGDYLVAVKHHTGQGTKQILAELLPRFITSLSFPKLMRWGAGDLLFARPIHWILALCHGEIIPFSLSGIESNNLSYGHRFTSPSPFIVSGFNSFYQLTEANQVIIDPKKRKEIIREQISIIARQEQGIVPDDPDLLETVTYLVEYPQVICGSFDTRFLHLPPQVLITSMRLHQKYFPMYDQNHRLMAKFIAVCNVRAEDYSLIRSGNERVLRARLSDAEFFYQEDRKKSLADLVESLKGVVFQEKLGTLYDKVERIRSIVSLLVKMVFPLFGTFAIWDQGENSRSQDKPLATGSTGVPPVEVAETFLDNYSRSQEDKVLKIIEKTDRAAYLCKADLLTEMVKEFPELQGVMGREYALRSGEDQEVAEAIFEHYLPRFQDDQLPKSLSGSLLAIADKIDNIVGAFGIGQIPTGSMDPYALRRQAQGIVNIILKGGYRLSLTRLIQDVICLFGHKFTRQTQEVQNEVMAFFQQRMNSIFSSQGYSGDAIEAVLATGDDDLVRIQKKIEAVTEFRKNPDFESLMTSFKRVINIIPREYKAFEPDPSAMPEEAEKKLYAKSMDMGTRVSARLKIEEYGQILQDLAGLKGCIDAFFEQILVMATDERLKQNRLSLLWSIRNTFFQVVDFSKIVPAERG